MVVTYSLKLNSVENATFMKFVKSIIFREFQHIWFHLRRLWTLSVCFYTVTRCVPHFSL